MSYVQLSCPVLYCDLAIKQAWLAAFISKNIPSKPFQILQLELWKVKQERNEARIYETQYKQNSAAIRPNYFAVQHMNSVLTNWYMCYYQPSSDSSEMNEGMSRSVSFFFSPPSPPVSKKNIQIATCVSATIRNISWMATSHYNSRFFRHDDAVLWRYTYSGNANVI